MRGSIFPRDLVDITMKKMDHDKDGRASLSDFREMASTRVAAM